jgi:hypothetical protein
MFWSFFCSKIHLNNQPMKIEPKEIFIKSLNLILW